MERPQAVLPLLLMKEETEMMRMLTLLAVTVLTVNSVGCCCCRGMRDWFYQGAYCGPTAAAVPAPMYATAPAPVFAAAPAPAVPVFPHCGPQVQAAAPQYAVAAPGPMPMAYSDPSCCDPYMTEMGCGTPYMTEMSCCCGDGTMMMPAPEAYPGPAPE
jgi:hypothetical protein